MQHQPLNLAHAQAQPFSRLAGLGPRFVHRLDDLEPVGAHRRPCRSSPALHMDVWRPTHPEHDISI
jgi:hypothetical protein